MDAGFKAGTRSLAILIDPDKIDHIDFLLEHVHSHAVQYFFIGGSGELKNSVDEVIQKIKQKSNTPCIIFPGSSSQLSDQADAIMILSLLSGRNPDYLNGILIEKAKQVAALSAQKIPVGYILVDGGVETSTQKITQTKPIDRNDVDLIVSTAIAGALLGHQAIYLEAGSGAQIPISVDIIKAVKAHIQIPLIVGGGIRNTEWLHQMWDAGADIVVIGNALEQQPDLLYQLNQSR